MFFQKLKFSDVQGYSENFMIERKREKREKDRKLDEK